MDKLKDYLQRNIEHLNIHTPNLDIFEKVISTVNGNRNPRMRAIPNRYLIGVAASIAILAFFIGFGYLIKRDKHDQVATEEIVKSKKDLPTKLKNDEFDLRESPVSLQPEVIDAPKNIAGSIDEADQGRLDSHVLQSEISSHHGIVDSINQQYKTQIDYYFEETLSHLASDNEEISYVKEQLSSFDKDEIELRNLIVIYGPRENLIQAVIRVNQQKIFFLRRYRHPLLKRESIDI